MDWDICNEGVIQNVYKHRTTSRDPVLVTDPKPISDDFAVLINKQKGVEVIVKINAITGKNYSGEVITVRLGDPRLATEEATFSLEHIDTLIRM